jgi:hypothetical protein
MIKRSTMIALAVIVLPIVAATNYHRFKSIEFRPGTDVEQFTAKIPQPCESVHRVLADRLKRSYRGMAARRAIENHSTMPGEERWSDPLGRWAGSAREVLEGSNGDGTYKSSQEYKVAPELMRYFDLPPAQRKRDWMLVHDDAPWDSEYYYRGAPAPFRSNSIVHLNCEDPAATTVEIFEDGANICVGEWFGLEVSHGHLLPNYSFGFHPDCRLVAPTRTERAELLKHVLALF